MKESDICQYTVCLFMFALMFKNLISFIHSKYENFVHKKPFFQFKPPPLLQLHVSEKYIHFLFLIATYNTYLAMPIKISTESPLSTQPLDTGWKTVVHELMRNQTCHINHYCCARGDNCCSWRVKSMQYVLLKIVVHEDQLNVIRYRGCNQSNSN